MKKLRSTAHNAFLAAPLLFSLAVLPVSAQSYNQHSDRNSERGNSYRQRDNHDQRSGRVQSNYYSGMREGARGGDYGGGHYDTRGDRGYEHQGGIGPGGGAAIGAAGGAVLGAIFGGGLKGAVIGGAAGAGVGAIAGEAHKQHERNEY